MGKLRIGRISVSYPVNVRKKQKKKSPTEFSLSTKLLIFIDSYKSNRVITNFNKIRIAIYTLTHQTIHSNTSNEPRNNREASLQIPLNVIFLASKWLIFLRYVYVRISSRKSYSGKTCRQGILCMGVQLIGVTILMQKLPPFLCPERIICRLMPLMTCIFVLVN